MPDNDRRPTPEEMLARARAEEASRHRGRLKVFFGASPGVGKTYAMLEEARARAREGTDVVIGWLETHGRKDTERLADGIERVPPRVVEYRGLSLREFDVSAALARRPALLLVDELAHTNAPGSQHARRWQDVDDLLNAGIDVYSTLNVQHLESLNDVIVQITKVAVRETIPDSVFETAAEVELVDLTPDDLLKRLREGKVYIPEQAQRAIDSFFQKGNLIALRELALQRTAERVDEQMTRWKREQGIAQPWPTRERLLVAVGPSPQSANLIRSTYRMATRLRAPWIALSIETPQALRLTSDDRDRLNAHLSLAERLGAETAVIAADTATDGILGIARQRNVTRIVVGKPVSKRWRDRVRGSLVDDLVRRSGAIDVLVTTGEEVSAASRVEPTRRAPAPLHHYGAAVAAVAASTLLCWIARPVLDLADQAMIYLLSVLLIASLSSRGPALLASLLSVAALDFFFVPPHFTFAVSEARYIVTFGVMLVTGLLVSSLTLRIREQSEASRQREQRTAVLYMMGRSFAFRSSVSEIAEAAARHVEVLFEAQAALLVPDDGGALVRRGGSDCEIIRDERELAVAKWVIEHGRAAGHGTDTLPAAAGLFLPVSGRKSTMGVLAVALGQRTKPLTLSQRQLLDLFVNLSALALERALLTEEAEKAQLAAETERLRSALLSAVSHDLRTPLAAVTGAATSLLDGSGELDEASRRDLLLTIREESEHLTNVLSDLLDITRIESGAVQVRKEWYPLEEVIGSALTRLDARLVGRDLAVSLPEALLMVPLDPVLAEQVFTNLIENALKYTAPGSPIEIAARSAESAVRVEVADRGAGIPPGEEEKIFEKFYRAGDSGSSTYGTGLGLAVCRAIMMAHGGRIWVENRPGGGATFCMLFPVEGAAPTAPESEGAHSG